MPKRDLSSGYLKLRFQVLQRDHFTCQYCGAHAPDVKLEVDHVITVADGGTDDVDNLVTACYACNRGRGDALQVDHPNRKPPIVVNAEGTWTPRWFIDGKWWFTGPRIG
jgi:5-methylcytosine-specific restriction endonuclease McrA